MKVEQNKYFTYEDYLKINDDNRYEIIGGDLILVPAPKTLHQRISGEIFAAIKNFIQKNNLGVVFYAPTDVVLTPEDKPQPDILYISKERLDIIKEQYIDGAPDLVVEVLSPSTASRDKVEKSRLYYAHGVKEYWIVDPDNGVVEVLIPGAKYWQIAGAYNRKETLLSPLLSGLEINLQKIFS